MLTLKRFYNFCRIPFFFQKCKSLLFTSQIKLYGLSPSQFYYFKIIYDQLDENNGPIIASKTPKCNCDTVFADKMIMIKSYIIFKNFCWVGNFKKMVFTDKKMRFSIETGKNETFYLKPTFSIENQTYVTYDMWHLSDVFKKTIIWNSTYIFLDFMNFFINFFIVFKYSK